MFLDVRLGIVLPVPAAEDFAGEGDATAMLWFFEVVFENLEPEFARQVQDAAALWALLALVLLHGYYWSAIRSKK